MKGISLGIISLIGLHFHGQTRYFQQQAHYQMEIVMNTKNHTYKGKQKISYQNNSPDTLKVVYFHLYWNAFQPGSSMDIQINNQGANADRRVITKVGDEWKSKISLLKPNEIGGHTIIKLLQNNKPTDFEVLETILKVTLPEPILPNSKTEFFMEWETKIPLICRRGGRNNSEGIDYSMTQWYPKLVAYDYEGWNVFDYVGREFHGIFSNFDVSISIDRNYVVAAGGQLQNPFEVKGYSTDAKLPKRGLQTYRFKADNILDFAWAADPDYTIETDQLPNGLTLYYAYQKSEKTAIWEQCKPHMRKFFELMEKTIGAYPYPTYSFIQGGDGGMEYGQCTLILGEGYDLKGKLRLMVHEAVHSWFQQIIANNETVRGWMDEGFTTFIEDFCMSKLFPESVTNYPNEYYPLVSGYTRYLQQNPNEEPMALFDDMFATSRDFSTSRYTKGAVFLVMLGYIIGEENLFKVLKEYFTTWKFKHPTETDFLRVAQKVSGMNLHWYFNLMIYSTRKINYAIEKVAPLGNKTHITLVNKGSFPMPLDIMVRTQNNTNHYFNIPTSLMKSHKTKEGEITYNPLPEWKYTATSYEFTINLPFESIATLIIDPSMRLADVDYSNNIYRR